MEKYRQLIYREWLERGISNTSCVRLCDLVGAIRKNVWFSKVELKFIRRRSVKQSGKGSKVLKT